MEIYVCSCGSDVINILDQCQICNSYLCFNCIIKDDTRCVNCFKAKTVKIRKQNMNKKCSSCLKNFSFGNNNCLKCNKKICLDCIICQKHNETCETCFRDSKSIPTKKIQKLEDTKFVKPRTGEIGTSRCAICDKRWCNDCGFQNVIYTNDLTICREHYVECVNIPCGKEYVPYFKCESCDNYLCPQCSKNGKCYQC